LVELRAAWLVSLKAVRKAAAKVENLANPMAGHWAVPMAAVKAA
jgi:hypothetical protein